MKLIQSYIKLDTRCCPKCGKMDNDILCSMCRFCGAYLDETDN